MKTSNKLLIAFGIFLFLAPLLSMVVVSKVYYRDIPKLNMSEIQTANNQPFHSASLGRKAIAFDKPFDAINFPDGNNFSVEVHVNKSENYGIKIPEELANAIKTEVSNDVLTIKFDKELALSNINQQIFIVVYMPNLEKLSAKNLMNLNLVAQTDSLNVRVNKCYFSVGNSDITQTEGNDKGETLSSKVYNQTIIKNLKVIGNNSNINLSGINLNSLNILAENDSEINLDQAPSEIKNLNLSTSGKNKVSIKNINFSNARTNFSDSTTLEIPTPLLKLLLKN